MTNTTHTNQIENEISNILELLNSLLGNKRNDLEEERKRQQKIARLNARLIRKDLELIDKDNIPALVNNLQQVNLLKISQEFETHSGDVKDLPRINFLGNFQYLSMTDQRNICKSIGFEYFKEIPIAATGEEQMSSISFKWTRIAPKYTKLIVIGNAYKFDDIKRHLYLKYLQDVKSRGLSLFQKHNIPIVMESEFIKLHKDYPEITKSTQWTVNKLTKLSG